MPVMDEFKEEREALKNGTPKEKIQYFWYYYKWHTIVGLIVIAMIVSIIKTVVFQKETAFYAAFLNAATRYTGRDIGAEFVEYAGIDGKTYDVMIDSSMFIDKDKMDTSSVSAAQRISVYLAAGDLDVLVTDTDSAQHYAYLDTLTDMKSFLTQEQYKQYEPYFYYVDMKVVKEIAAANDNMDLTYEAVYPEDPFDPTTMEEPVAVGICVDQCPILRDNYYFREDSLIFSVFCTSRNQELNQQFLEYLMQAK